MVAFSGVLVGMLALLILGAVIAWTVLVMMRPNAFIQLTPSEGSLANPTNVGTIDQVRKDFFASPGCTFTCYIYCGLNNKTAQIGPKQDSHNLISFGNSVKLQMLPGGASGQPKTQLVIKTQSDSVQTETLDVAPFPLQKWVYLAIVREGRRYTVYYNGSAVSSQRTQYFPIISSSNILIGDPNLRGYFAFPRLTGTVLEKSELQSYKNLSSDTREKPYISNPQWKDFLELVTTTIGCPNGIFCFTTNSPPNDPTKSWKSSYS